MADERGVTYDIGVNTGDAQSNLDKLESTIEGLDESTARVQVGAQGVSGALSGMGAAGVGAAREASGAAADMGRSFENAGTSGVSAARQVSGAASDMGDSFDDASNEARAAIKKMGAEAESFGAAFKKTMAAGIKDGQSLAKSFQTGVGGALAFTDKKFTGFRNNISKGAKAIGTAFLHPIKTIKGDMVKALEKAENTEDDVGKAARNAEKDVKGLGDTGAKSGNQITQAMSSALKAFLGFQAIKAGASALKNFVSDALGAAAATEKIGAKFDRVFADTGVEEWAQTFSKAINRNKNEVKDFLVQNKAMYTELGITGAAADQLSQITTSLAYDFGAAFKMDDAEALSLLQGAIQGNTSALAEYGFKLDDSVLKEEALKVGLSDQLDKLDEATLAQLRMNAIMAQSSDVQRAAIEQTGGLVNSTKSLKGIWSNFMEAAGSKFTPVIEKFFGSIIDAWPRIEPALMGLVDLLTDGLSQALPFLTEIGMNLLPILADILGTVFKVVTPLLPMFNDLAQVILPPLAALFGELASSVLPPLTDIFSVLVEDIIRPLLPIVMELISILLPPFVELLSMVSPILKMISPLLSMLAELLVPIASVIADLISSILPPLMTILDTIFTSILQPLMPIITSLVETLLPPLASLLGLIAPILGLISPILEAISPVLEVIGSVMKIIADVLAKTIGFLADGVGKVVGFFSNLFGGAKESKREVEGLNGAVNGLDAATSKETSLAVDTSEYAKDITSASTEANKVAQDNIIATKDISDLNLKLMGTEASSTYSTMAIDAETAWSRMVKAAEDGAAKIVSAFGKIASAAQGVSGANISVTGASIPGNASGTDNFEGGWTHINERGGELAFLPSGSAIIPADKTDRILEPSPAVKTEKAISAAQPERPAPVSKVEVAVKDDRAVKTEKPPIVPTDDRGERIDKVERTIEPSPGGQTAPPPDFAPKIEIKIEGSADARTVEELERRLPEILKKTWADFKAEELQLMQLKNAYT